MLFILGMVFTCNIKTDFIIMCYVILKLACDSFGLAVFGYLKL